VRQCQSIGSQVRILWQVNLNINKGRFSYSSPQSGTLLNQNVSVTYSSALTAAPTRVVALGIVDFKFSLSDSNMFIYVVNVGMSQTGFIMNVQVNVDTYFLAPMKISYLTVDPSFTQPFSVNYFTVVIK
jgi:hypothetical protein